jgi:hypothetical protein
MNGIAFDKKTPAVHVIRLGGRWELVPGHVCGTPAGTALPMAKASGEWLSLPFDWNLDHRRADANEITLRRAFHRPTGIGPSHRVALAIAYNWLQATVWLNEVRLGDLMPQANIARWDVTSGLSRFNQLSLLLTAPADADVLDTTATGHARLQSVILEIDDDATPSPASGSE